MPDRPLDLDQYTSVVTSQGVTLYCRIVPPFAQAAVRRRLPDPPLPRVKVKSASGDNMETHPALPGTPEYEEYLQARVEHKHELGMALQRFTIHYGVVAWRFKSEGPGTCHTEQPEDWKVPQALRDYGVEDLDGPERRSQYILYELILTDEDLAKVEAVLLPTSAVGREEIAAALAPFVSSTMVDHSSTASLPPQEKEAE